MPSSMKERWSKGLQWGAVAWLAHIVGRQVYLLSLDARYALRDAHYSVPPSEFFAAAAWLVALLLLWTRWSRAAVGLAIGTWALQSATACAVFPDAHLAVRAWAFQLTTILPLLPLLVLEPERPRLTVALVLVGRWRDARRELAGWRWVAIAAGLYLLERSANRALGCNSLDQAGALRFALLPMLLAFVPQAALFGLAALPPLRAPTTA
jgi:hypothetical protein